MDEFSRIRPRLEEIIKRSPVPEDYLHASNILKWLKTLKQDPDPGLNLAAFAHDIERAVPGRRVRKGDYPDFRSFKLAHAWNSARIIREILSEEGFNEDFIGRIHHLVANHEFGGDEESDLIMCADSLSFFDVNINLYLTRHSLEEVKERAQWSYQKLPPRLKKTVQDLLTRREKADILFPHSSNC